MLELRWATHSPPHTGHNLSPGAQSRLVLANWGAVDRAYRVYIRPYAAKHLHFSKKPHDVCANISAYMLKQRKKHAYRPQPREQQPRAGAVVAEGALLH